MSNHYTKTFLPSQFAIGLICWLIYRAAAPDPGPAATLFIVLQVSAVIASIWTNRLRKAAESVTSRLLN